jgi:hypothetical protein
MKTALALLFTVLVGSSAFALECEPSPEGASLEVSGFGEVQTAGLEYDGDVAVLYEACLKRGDWLLRFDVLRVTNPDEDASLEAETATLESEGARGSLRNLRGSVKSLSFAVARLELDPTFRLEGFPRARYAASAATGRFEADTLTLEGAVLDRLSSSGATEERYAVALARLRAGTAVLSDVRLLQPSLAISAQSGANTDGEFSVSEINGRLGRNAAGSEVTFTAASAVRLEGGVLQFQGATLFFLGVPIHLGGVQYDPRCPLELPLVISPFGGLTFGFDGIRFNCGGNARATIVGYDMLSATPEYAAFVTASEGPLSLFFGQRRDETVRGQLSNIPESGFTAAGTLDAGTNLEGTIDTERFMEARFGLAQAFNLSVLRLRPRIEVGAVAQFKPDADAPVGDVALVYTSVGVSGGGQVAAGPVTFSIAGSSSYTLYSDGSSGANGVLGLGARLNLSGFSIGVGVRYQQQFVPSIIGRHNIESFTRLDADARYAPVTPPPAFGFAGLRLERPVLGVLVEYDPRNAAFVHQRFELGFALVIYDGVVLVDNFGQPFQTPNFAIAPRGVYDLVTLAGEVGAVFSISGLGLIYDIGLAVTLPNAGLNFSFGVRLR